MKRIISNVMLFAAAAMVFFSCNKQEMAGPEMLQVSGLTFASEKPAFDDDTKTEWTGTTIQWSKDDAIRVGYTCDGVWQNAAGNATAAEENGKKTAKLYASSRLAEAAASAKFSVPGNFEGTAAGTYEFYGVYPSGACVNGTGFTYAPSVTVEIPEVQTPAADSFDSAADIMVAKSPSTYTGIPTDPISLEWTRLVAHGYITLKGLALTDGEELSAITLTANEEADMVGNHYVYLDTYNVTKPNSNSAANVLTINAANLTADAEGNVTFWASFLPCTWTSIKVVVETDKATYTREIDLSSNQKTFAQNARNRLAVGMSTATREEKVIDDSDYSGTYAIVAEKSKTEYYYLTNVDNGASAKRLNSSDAISTLPSSGVKLEASLVWNVIKNADGSYYIQSAENNYYLNHTGGNSSVLVENIEDALALTIEQNEGKYLISYLNGTETRNFVRNSSNPYFAFYTSEQCGPVYFVPAVATFVPSITVENTEISVAHDATTVEFTYTAKNITGEISAEVAGTPSMSVTDVTANEGTVTVTFDANTEETVKTATIVLSYTGATDVEVTITQAAKLPEGTTEWVLTSFANLKAGDQVVIVGIKSSTSYAMSNDNGTSNPPVPVEVTISGDKLASDPNSNCVWYVGESESNRIFYADAANGAIWLYCTNANNGVRVGTNTNKTFTLDSTSGYLKHVGTGRYLGIYNTQDWRCYTSINSNISGQTFKFFVKQVGGSAEGGETPDPEEPEIPGVDVTEYTAEITLSTYGSSWSSYADRTGVVTGTDNKTYTVAASMIASVDSKIQARSSKSSIIYNTQSFGNIKSIQIEDGTGATFTVTVGKSSNSGCTTNTSAEGTRIFNIATDGNGFFKIVNSNTTIAKITKIKITYTN